MGKGCCLIHKQTALSCCKTKLNEEDHKYWLRFIYLGGMLSVTREPVITGVEFGQLSLPVVSEQHSRQYSSFSKHMTEVDHLAFFLLFVLFDIIRGVTTFLAADAEAMCQSHCTCLSVLGHLSMWKHRCSFPFADQGPPLHFRNVLGLCAVLREWIQGWFEKLTVRSKLSVFPRGSS